MKSIIMILTVSAVWLLPVPAVAHPILKNCPTDSVKSGTTCMDKYEESVWRVPNPTGVNKKLVKKIRKGKVTEADLKAGVLVTRLGESSDDYLPCNDNGSSCADVFAVSIAGVKPSSYITWFQAQQACKNSQKRLPSNAEWQVTVTGTPDTGGSDDGSTKCNTDNLVPGVSVTGARSGCVSQDGAFDMVGNLEEWVADWVPASTDAPGWGTFSDDYMSLSGASKTVEGPHALIRGGIFFGGVLAGPFGLFRSTPYTSNDLIGFRCSR